jgi:hydrogenase maturation protease
VPDTLIVCVGNDLVADDGVGPEIFARMSRAPLPEGMRLCLLGTSGLALLDELQGGERLIVVDAVMLGGPPGHVHVFAWDEIPEALGQAVTSHGIGVKEVVRVGRLLFPERMPVQIFLVGVEGRCFDQFAPMSAEVNLALDAAAAAVLALVKDARRDL